jgi:hypothetical protein
MEGAYEGELQPYVKDDPDHHRPDDGQRDVAPGVTGLPSELDGLLEALIGEHYTPDAEGAKNTRNPERGEATLGGKVGGVEGHDYEDDDGEEGDRDFQIMMALLDFARLPIPRRFMMVNTPMSATEKTIPSAVRTSVPP